MIQIYRKTARENSLKELEKFVSGSWLYAEDPEKEELEYLTTQFGLDIDLLRDGLDQYEVPRMEISEDILYIYTRFPYRSGEKVVTVPLLIASGKNFILTLSEKALPFLENMLKARHHFSTVQQTHFLLQFLVEIDESYGTFLNRISRSVRSLKIQIEDIGNKDIIKFINFEETLNDLIAALSPMGTILQKLSSRKPLKFSSAQKEEIKDLMLRNGELSEICKTNLRTIVNIREGYSTIMTNNLNRVIKILTALTIVLTIPTTISSLYGMNVDIPLSGNPYAFWWILGGTLILTLSILILLWKKKWI